MAGEREEPGRRGQPARGGAAAPVPPDSGAVPSGDPEDVGRGGVGAEPATLGAGGPGLSAGTTGGIAEAALGGGTDDLGGGGDLGGDPVGRGEDAEPDENRP
jgi:hypothetical protein